MPKFAVERQQRFLYQRLQLLESESLISIGTQEFASIEMN